MHRVHRALSLSLTLVLALAACEEQPTQPSAVQTPQFSRSEGNSREFEFTPLAASAACRVPTTDADYKPFDLPAGFEQTIIADEISDFRPVAGTGGDLPDMLTFNETGPQRDRFIYRTHEVGSNGAITVTDTKTGITSLVDQQSHYEALDGIVWTSWGTLLFAEERIVASLKDPRVPDAVGGLVYELNPRTRTAVPLPAVGARSHEGLRFDSRGNLYGISESTPGVNGSGAVYKFVPDRRGSLASGQLYVLKVLDAATRTGAAVWVPLDRNAVKVNSDAAAIAVGATGWGRPEDIEITFVSGKGRGHGDDDAYDDDDDGDDDDDSGAEGRGRRERGVEVMYVAMTSEDLVIRVELAGDEAFVSNYVKEGINVSGLDSPDNLALDPDGNLYIAEDRSQSDIFVARGVERAASSVVRFASLSDCAAETTGIYFDRKGRKLYLHVQHAGGTAQNDLAMTIQPVR